jgi:hypothetical protein
MWLCGSACSTGLGELVSGEGLGPVRPVSYGIFSIPAGLSTDYVYANLETGCGGGGTVLLGVRSGGTSCDFSHTGALSLGGLDGTGVSFTSGSGMLLSQTQTAAPEPGSWILMMAGVGLVGLAKLRVARNTRLQESRRNAQ